MILIASARYITDNIAFFYTARSNVAFAHARRARGRLDVSYSWRGVRDSSTLLRFLSHRAVQLGMWVRSGGDRALYSALCQHAVPHRALGGGAAHLFASSRFSRQAAWTARCARAATPLYLHPTRAIHARAACLSALLPGRWRRGGGRPRHSAGRARENRTARRCSPCALPDLPRAVSPHSATTAFFTYLLTLALRMCACGTTVRFFSHQRHRHLGGGTS